jgi:hypothetical protein
MPNNFKDAQMVTVIHKTLNIIYRSLLVARAAKTKGYHLFYPAHSTLLRFAAQSYNRAKYFITLVLLIGSGVFICVRNFIFGMPHKTMMEINPFIDECGIVQSIIPIVTIKYFPNHIKSAC